MSKDNRDRCKGCWELDNNCKTCYHCIETKPEWDAKRAREPLMGIGPGAVVRIEWDDSRIVSQGWVDPNTLHDAGPARCTTYGMVVIYSNDSIIIAQSVGSKHVQGAIAIPVSAVVKCCRLVNDESAVSKSGQDSLVATLGELL